MRYTKEELQKNAAIYLKHVEVIYGCTDGHFFYEEHVAKKHADKNKVEYFPFKKTTKKTD